ncbi:MAG: pilus assembly protein [Deltaproteobacteria bacterium]|nr:pilus assembly protein [Deltaproteobacteria bacterium]
MLRTFLPSKASAQFRARVLDQRAATLIETAIILPLFLFFILFVIWLGISFHEKATLSTSLGGGLRAAATRSDFFLMNSSTGILPAVQAWSGGSPDPALKPVLAHNAPGPSDWGEEFYDSVDGTSKVFGGLPLGSLPKPYIFALIYVHESLRQSLGGSVRYPCDPYSSTDPAGCVGCRFLNPEDGSLDPYVDGSGNLLPPPTDRLGLQCDYRPANFIIGPLTRILGQITGNPTGGSSLLVFSAKKQITFRTGSHN